MPPGLHLDPDGMLAAARLADDLASLLHTSRVAFAEHRAAVAKRMRLSQDPDLDTPLRRAAEELSATAELLRHTAATVLRADADAARTFGHL